MGINDAKPSIAAIATDDFPGKTSTEKSATWLMRG
jgi:hypothetical protein